jgi:hypothetical protein
MAFGTRNLERVELALVFEACRVRYWGGLRVMGRSKGLKDDWGRWKGRKIVVDLRKRNFLNVGGVIFRKLKSDWLSSRIF